MYFSSKSKSIFLMAAIYVSCSMAMQTDIEKTNLPGCRSAYVRNHPEKGNLPNLLEFALRKCICRNGNVGNICPCWSSFDESDQPAVQGDFCNILYCYKLFNGFFPGFEVYRNPLSQEITFGIPSPDSFSNILNSLQMGHVELVSGTSAITVDEYLSLLSKKKIPLAKIPERAEINDVKMQYHLYIHDLLNHALLWVAFPDVLRDLIAKRASKLSELAALIEYSFKEDQNVLDLLSLLKYYAVKYFDTDMGSLNIFLFSRHDSFMARSEYEKKMIAYYEGTCNFGIHLISDQGCSNISKTILDINKFVSIWFFVRSQFVIDQLIKIEASGDLKDFNTINTIRRDPQILAALNRLKDNQINDIKEARQKLLNKISDHLGTKIGKDIDSDDELPSLESFCAEVKSKLKTAIDSYKNSLGFCNN